MAFFKLFTDPRQARIDGLVAENLHLYAEIAKTGVQLTDAKNDLRIEREQHRHTAAERDSYRERLLRFTAPRERGPGGRFLKPKPATNGAAGQAVRHG